MDTIDPVEYGRLLSKVESLENKVSDMDRDIKQLLALANQSKGGFWMGMAVASVFGSLATWLAQHWMK